MVCFRSLEGFSDITVCVLLLIFFFLLPNVYFLYSLNIVCLPIDPVVISSKAMVPDSRVRFLCGVCVLIFLLAFVF